LAAARVAGLERFEISVTLASAFRQSRASPAGRYAPSYVMEISASATIEIARPREAVFDFACSNDTYERLFRKRGPVAGVVKATMADGAAPADGARRRVELSDGSVVDEIIVLWDRSLESRIGQPVEGTTAACLFKRSCRDRLSR